MSEDLLPPHFKSLSNPYDYESLLAPYAQKSSSSRGRRYPEMPHPLRNPYQRDRDRIIHSRAFRRLEYKTQVLLNHIGDHYRTRLTHSLEVSQVSRSIARNLRLNEDLVEAIALAHDLGHPPFGHAGENRLNEIMKEEGGFEHNLQSLRIIDQLENKYLQFPGLNLTYELRKSLLKHPRKQTSQVPAIVDLKPSESPPLEAQLVDLADEITYSCHDLEDGLSFGCFSWEALQNLKIIKKLKLPLMVRKKSQQKEVLLYHLIRNLLDFLVKDLLEYSLEQLKRYPLKKPEDVYQCSEIIISLSPNTKEHLQELRQFLFKNFYRHEKIVPLTEKGVKIISFLYDTFTKEPHRLPQTTQEKIKEEALNRVVCDYIAGMTDRYAIESSQQLGLL